MSIPEYATLNLSKRCVDCGQNPLRYWPPSEPLGIPPPQVTTFVNLAAFPCTPPEYSYRKLDNAYCSYPSCGRLGTRVCSSSENGSGDSGLTAGWDAEQGVYYDAPFGPNYTLEPPARFGSH